MRVKRRAEAGAALRAHARCLRARYAGSVALRGRGLLGGRPIGAPIRALALRVEVRVVVLKNSLQVRYHARHRGAVSPPSGAPREGPKAAASSLLIRNGRSTFAKVSKKPEAGPRVSDESARRVPFRGPSRGGWSKCVPLRIVWDERLLAEGICTRDNTADHISNSCSVSYRSSTPRWTRRSSTARCRRPSFLG